MAIYNQTPNSGGVPLAVETGAVVQGVTDGFADFSVSDYLDIEYHHQIGAGTYRLLAFRVRWDTSSPTHHSPLLGRQTGSNEGVLLRVNSSGTVTSAMYDSGGTLIQVTTTSGSTKLDPSTDPEGWIFWWVIPKGGGGQGKLNIYDNAGNQLGTEFNSSDPTGSSTVSLETPATVTGYHRNLGNAVDEMTILEIRMYDVGSSAPAAAYYEGISDGSDDRLSDMVLWYVGSGTPPTPTPNPRRGDTPSYWLLDFQLGGQPWRYSTEALTVNSRRQSDLLRYRAGLTGLDFEVERDTVSVQIRAAEEDTWARSRRRYGPFSGRPFVLRRWYLGTDLEDAQVVIQGVVDSAQYGDASDPATLTLELSRATHQLADMIPTPDMRITRRTWPRFFDGTGGAGGFTLDIEEETPNSIGKYYPIVIGYPGWRGSQFNLNAVPATPLLAYAADAIPPNVGNWLYMAAGHQVEATDVLAYDMANSSKERVAAATWGLSWGPVTGTGILGTDALGRGVTYTSQSDISGRDIRYDGRELLAGWSPEYGGGLVYEGQLIRGLGDVLYWIARVFLTPVVIDWKRLEQVRPRLNRYVIDTCINEPTNVIEWLEAEVYDLFEVEEVHGPEGLYWREVEYDADPTAVHAYLSADADGRGHRVTREGAILDSGDEIANQLTLLYGPRAMATDVYDLRLTYGPDPSKIVGGNATGIVAVNQSLATDIRCQQSLGLYGLRQWQDSTALLWDAVAADLVVRKKIARHALPAQMVEYRGGPALADLRKYGTVSLTDTTDGASFPAGTLAVVWRIVIEDEGTLRVQLRVPADPLRDPATQE